MTPANKIIADSALGGTAEDQAAFRRWQAEQRAAEDRRIAGGDVGDVPDPLTDEDEAILDRVWGKP
jgi:hypothetical protein